MKNKTTFTKDDLRGFILLFCANANFEVSQLEYEYIEPRIGTSNFKNLYMEILRRNDYQIITEIQSSIQKINFTKEDVETLLDEIKNMFRIDTSNYNQKRNVFRGLKRILL